MRTSEMVWTDGDKVRKIWEQINRAAYIVADCSGRNANVFYELGIAHTLGKPTYLCASARDDFPFDIRNIHSYVYDDLTRDSMSELTKDLKNWLTNASREV